MHPPSVKPIAREPFADEPFVHELLARDPSAPRTPVAGPTPVPLRAAVARRIDSTAVERTRQALLLLFLGLAALLLGLGVLTGCGEGGEEAAGGGASAPPPAASSDDSSSALEPSPSPDATASSAPAPARKPAAKLVFVNVGQGDAILVISGKTEVLVDGGPQGSDAAVARALRRAGVDDLDVVVATHMHADHVGATDELIETYRPNTLVVAGACSSTLKTSLRRAGAKLRQARRGDTFRWGKVRARVLSPASISGEANEDSLVLLLEVAGRRILLTGDLSGPNEAAVGSICARGPPLFLLKVAHHGSRYSTGASFLADTDPRFAVISVGPNSYGHPTPDTVGRLRDSGARVYTTQKNGTITLTIKPSGAVSWRFGKTSKPVTRVAAASSTSPATTSTSSSASTVVYITRTGECYHLGTCQYLSQSKIEITLADAKARDYRPCSVCDPPQ